MRLGKLIIFEPLFFPTELDIFDIRQHHVRILFIFQRLICCVLFFSNTDKHEFSSLWKWISCYNDVMNHVDCVIKSDVYLQKMHSSSKNICGKLFFVLKIFVVYQKNHTWVILHGHSRS